MSDSGAAAVETVAVPASAGLSEWVEDKLAESDRPELTSAGVVVSGGRGVGSEDDFAIIEDNPTFQLFEPEFVLDVRCIAANDRQVSINNALSVDLTGQINAETVFGVRMINGTGG